MPATNTLTYDATTPFRPGLSDLGGSAKEDDPGYAPDPITMPTAAEHNQFALQLGAINKVIGTCKITVTISGGVPSISNVKALGTNVVAGSFTVVRVGTGDTIIRWAAGTVLPATAGAPEVSQCDDTEIDRIRAFYTTSAGLPAVEVKTKLGAAATDCNFVVTIG